jgi:hypothetical protein
MTTTDIGSFARRRATQSDAFNAMADRARELRTRADALRQLEADLRTRAKALDRREADLVADEERLRKHERRLAAAGQELTAREDTLTHQAVRERFSHTLAELTELETPTLTITDGVANPSALAAAIIHCGKVRRGEVSNRPPIPPGVAGQIVRAGMRRRGELVDTPKPRTEQTRCGTNY